MSAAKHPVIAVVDVQGEWTIVWHVQTGPDTPSGALSGAWILGPGEIDPARLDDLLTGTVVLPVGDVEEAVIGTRKTVSLAGVAEAVTAAVDEIGTRAKAAKEANNALTPPRLDAIVPADPRELAAGFHGEEIGRAAWSTATALAELIEQWHTVESQRRSRKYLQEALGEEVRPLPLA